VPGDTVPFAPYAYAMNDAGYSYSLPVCFAPPFKLNLRDSPAGKDLEAALTFRNLTTGKVDIKTTWFANGVALGPGTEIPGIPPGPRGRFR